jgi:macrolide transport system ATP-binding/permease protein
MKDVVYRRARGSGARLGNFLTDLLQDLRYAARALRQTPTFTLIAVLSLALGIGASTSVYALAFALFFAPPAGIDRPASLVRICRFIDGKPEGHELSHSDYVFYRDHVSVFSALASDGNLKTLTDTEQGEQLLAAIVSPNYFSVLGVQPRVGRFFLADEDTAAGHNQVVVLSHAFWQRRFAGDPHSVSRFLTLAGMPYAIVGVAPANFASTSAGWTPDIFVPTRAAYSEADLANPKSGLLDLIGRLKPGRTLAEAQAEMAVLALQLAQANPTRSTRLFVSKLTGIDPEARSSEARLPALLAATVGCLLLIACVNLAGLLQTRHAARSKEIAMRLALGAGRGRVVRQLLTESLLLSALGGGGGLVVAWWGKALLERAYTQQMFEGTRHTYSLTLDSGAFVLTLLMAVTTGVLFGLVPALQASHPALVPALKEDASASRRSRLRSAFLVVQVALSLVLLVGAALAIQSTRTLWKNPGIDAEHIAFFYISPARAGYRSEQAAGYVAELRRRLESLSFVESMSTSWVPPPFWLSTASVSRPGQNPARPEDALKVPVNWISGRFFETLRIPVINGRGIEPRDTEQGRSLVVVNEALAHRVWTDQDPVGRTLLVGGKPFEVVGTARFFGLRAEGDTSRPYLFISEPGARQRAIFVQVKGDPVAALPSLRREILAVDASVPIDNAMPLTSVIANQQTDVPIAMGVLSFAGGVALFLATLGLYGVVALSASQRTREIGIRLALGARPAGIATLVLREGFKLVVIGVPLGLGAALFSVRLLSSYLYGVSKTDAATFGGIAGLLAGVALLACYVPARQAMRADPVQALRHD